MVERQSPAQNTTATTAPAGIGAVHRKGGRCSQDSAGGLVGVTMEAHGSERMGVASEPGAAVGRLTEPSRGVPPRAEAELEAAVAIIDARFAGIPHASLRRSVALLYEALSGLFGTRENGYYPDPQGFRLPLDTIARETVSLARRRGSAVRAIDALEVRAILDALVAVRMLTVIETGDPASREPG